MKRIKTDGIYELSPVGGGHTWYWGMDYTSGDLYEAEELYKGHYPIHKNRIVYVRYPDGCVIEPVIAEEGQYLGAFPLYYENKIYTLLVDFLKNKIYILSFDPEAVLNGDGVQTVAALPLSVIKDCYNLLLKAAPVMLTRQSAENDFQILWTEPDGLMDVEFQVEERESFSHAEGDMLYFTSWREKEEPVYEYREETTIRNTRGEIIKRMGGGIFEIQPGTYWVLE